MILIFLSVIDSFASVVIQLLEKRLATFHFFEETENSLGFCKKDKSGHYSCRYFIITYFKWVNQHTCAWL